MQNISSDVIRGYNDTMILYLLWEKPSYGYEISKQIKTLSDEKYVIKETTLYSAFTRMEQTDTLSRSPTQTMQPASGVPITALRMPVAHIIGKNAQSGGSPRKS